MKSFEELMNHISETKDVTPKSIELPNEIMKVDETKETTSEASENPESFKDIMDSGKVQLSWTTVTTSRTCGCNNACMNSCYNVG